MGQEPEAPAADAVAEKPAGQEPEPAPAAKEAKEPQTFGADYVKQLRSENAGARKKAQELEARLSRSRSVTSPRYRSSDRRSQRRRPEPRRPSRSCSVTRSRRRRRFRRGWCPYSLRRIGMAWRNRQP